MNFRWPIIGYGRWLLLVQMLVVSGAAVVSGEETEVLFNRDVRPILSDKCFHCHGFDAATREAGLRLDTREGAIEGKAIVPGILEEGELLKRVISDDPSEVMPPPKSKLGKLTSKELEILKRWILQGAKYQQHWSFEPLAADAGEGTLDEKVERKLAERGLKLQPEAEKSVLIRRVTFDLTGLPPTTSEVREFLEDQRPDAYEHLVDRLLASPRFGERMAVDWLDVARYADSYGFQVDRERKVWPWRDWVVKAFNQNMRYDDFVIWQLAGDLLPNATEEQILATAFNRLHQQESEGGSVEEEYRREYVSDRLHTVGTAFLGLTLECARCHDHKYDPISQKEYYEMAAFFENIDEAGLYSYFTESVPTPALTMIGNEAERRELDQAEEELSLIEKEGPEIKDRRRADFENWMSARNEEVRIKNELGHFAFDQSPDPKFPNVKITGENKLVEGRVSGTQAILFTGDDGINLPLGNFSREESFGISLWIKPAEAADRAVILHRSRAWTDAGSRGYELLIEDGRLKWSLIHFWPGNAISIKDKNLVQVGEWMHVVVSYDGSSKASGLKLFVNGKVTDVEVVRDGLTRKITGGGGDQITLGERFRDRGFKGGMIDEVRVFGRELGDVEARWLFDGDGKDKSGDWFAYYLREVDEVWDGYLKRLQEARKKVAQVYEKLPEMMVMKELDEPKQSYVLIRGEYDKRGEEVSAATPAALPPLPEGMKRNRLTLAKWLTDPGHPLTARVTVNRWWQLFFGRGLVKTVEDFGSQGEKPLHAEALDWLAGEFIRSGWDVKGLIRKMVTTRTYRQRSYNHDHPPMMMDDPDNEWLSRGPRFRLSAEMIRDNVLMMSGLLDESMGGPPVNPYEMAEAFKPVKESQPNALYRRSLYTNWRRTSPPPAMLAFDAPRRAVCSVKRERTDSPLQALILLNGPQFVEAAKVIAMDVLTRVKGDRQKMIRDMFLRGISRSPDAVEESLLRQLFEEQLEYYEQHQQEAQELLNVGNAIVAESSHFSHIELAAATVLAQAVMNLDECVVKR